MITADELAEYLRTHHLGAANAVTNGVLSERFGFDDRGASGRHGIRNSARLTAVINLARRNNHPICADRRGIFYAMFRDEVDATIKFNRKTAWKLLAVAEMMEQAATRLPDRS